MSDPQTVVETAELFVLGLLDEAEARAAAARLDTDPEFAEAVAATRSRFAPIDETADRLEPSRELWGRIETAIAAPAAVALVTARGPQPSAPDVAARRVRRWRAAGLTAMAASLVLAVALAWQVFLPQQPIVVAVLVDDDRNPVAIIEDFGGSELQVTSLQDRPRTDGRTFQLWTKWSDEVGPVSLGVLGELTSRGIVAPGLPTPQPGQLYEITIEGPGGSPTGLPTGPIVGLGLALAPQ